jgi:hypothetical protein
MSRFGIEQMLYLMDQSFGGESHAQHSLLANLASVTDEDWLWVPPGGARSIRWIVGHVGACKYMYDDYAFGPGAMRWDDAAEGLGCSMEELQSGRALDREPAREGVIAWVSAGHERLRDHVAALENDYELLTPRRANWGGEYETRWIVTVMVQHDLYHAGEINHIRALRQGNDAWPEY